MFKELEAQAEKPAAGEQGPEGICDCQCSEPATRGRGGGAGWKPERWPTRRNTGISTAEHAVPRGARDGVQSSNCDRTPSARTPV